MQNIGYTKSYLIGLQKYFFEPLYLMFLDWTSFGTILMVNLGSLKYRYNIPLIYFTLILSFWIHCIETHIAGSTCLKRESSIYIGGFWMEDYISCWLYKLKYTLVWHSLKPECYSACTKVLESGLGPLFVFYSLFPQYFSPNSPLKSFLLQVLKTRFQCLQALASNT